MDPITVASYDLPLQLPVLGLQTSPSISAQTQSEEQPVAVNLALVPVPNIVEERHVVSLVLLPSVEEPLLGQGRSDRLGGESVYPPRARCRCWCILIGLVRYSWSVRGVQEKKRVRFVLALVARAWVEARNDADMT